MSPRLLALIFVRKRLSEYGSQKNCVDARELTSSLELIRAEYPYFHLLIHGLPAHA